MEVTKLVLKNVRAGYEHVWEKSSSSEKAEPKYSLEILIPKTDKKTIAEIQEAIKKHSDDFAKSCKGGKLPKDFDTRFWDGDDDSEYEHRAGNMVLTAKNARPVLIIGPKKEMLAKGEFKGGDYCNVSIAVYAYKEGGIAYFLNGVQKVRDGEAIVGGAGNAMGDFEEVETDDTDMLG